VLSSQGHVLVVVGLEVGADVTGAGVTGLFVGAGVTGLEVGLLVGEVVGLLVVGLEVGHPNFLFAQHQVFFFSVHTSFVKQLNSGA